MAWIADFRTGQVTITDGAFATVKVSISEGAGSSQVVGSGTRARFKWERVIDKINNARQKSLRIAGMEIRRAVQREMSVRAPLKNPRLVDIGTVGGERLVVKRRQIPRGDRVTSWKTANFPKGFLRNDIQYDYDAATDSVVVGPAKLPRLNKLHEIGGSVPLWFVRSGPPSRVPRRFSGSVFGFEMNRRADADAVSLGRKRVKARGYMARGLRVGKGKIPAAFRDSIVGP